VSSIFISGSSTGLGMMAAESLVSRGHEVVLHALEKLGINKRIGWHTFRHSFSTLLRQLGTDIKVQQDLLRHSSARLTLDTYTQAVTPAKRDAQNAVVELLFVGRLEVVAAPTVKI